MTSEREHLSWQGFGDASREMAQAIADDGFRPDLILAIARAGCSSPGPWGTRWR